MKAISKIALFFLLSLSAFAKMASQVEVHNIQQVTIEDGKITIVGDALFTYKIETSKENNDLGFYIMGQQRAEYKTVQGHAVEFTITPYIFRLHDPTGELAEDPKMLEIKNSFKQYWEESMAAVKALEKGGSIELTIQGTDIRWHDGQLKSVRGQGMSITPK